MNGARAYGTEMWVASALVLAAGIGTVATLSGAVAGTMSTTIAGGVLLAISLTALVAAGWIDPVLLVAISIPLPAIYSTDTMRIAAAAPVSAAVVGAWLLGLGASGRPLRTGRLPAATTAALFAVFAIATVTAQYVTGSIRETLNFAVLLGFLVVATDSFSRDRNALPDALRGLVCIGAICGVLAVLEMLRIIPGEFPRYNTAFNRAALGFGQPNALGLFFAVLVPFAVHLYTTARDGLSKLFIAGALACLAAGLIATFSRGSWLAVIAGAGMLFFTGNRGFVLRIIVTTALVVVFADIVTGGAMRDTVQRTIGDWVIEQRAALMFAGLLMFLAYPITGVGPGGYAESLDRFGPRIPELWDYLPTPHNAYVQMAAETGIIGLIVFLFFIVTTLIRQVRRTRYEDALAGVSAGERGLNRALLWSMATAAASCMVVWPFSHGTGQMVMIVAAGIYAAPPRPAPMTDEPTPETGPAASARPVVVARARIP